MSAPSEHRIRLFFGFSLELIGSVAAVASVYATPACGASTLRCGLEALSCDVALTSRFSKIGGIPLGVFGLFSFSFWTLNLRAFRRTGDGIYRAVFFWVTIIGAMVSLTLGVIMFFVLKAPCLYCLLSHASNLISVALLWPVFAWKPEIRWASGHVWHFLALTSISILAALSLALADRVRTLEAILEASKRTLW
jgi:uncharacterized membrane protein